VEVKLKQQAKDFWESCEQAFNKMLDMLCAAYVVKHGHGPSILRDPQQGMVAWCCAPAETEVRHSRGEFEDKMGAQELELLAQRYRQATKLEPEDALVRLVYHQDSRNVEVKFERRP
jgi:hypothetical protein